MPLAQPLTAVPKHADVQQFRSIEALRALAAIMVVLFHTQAIFSASLGILPVARMFGAGLRGVDLFFVLSGFIIAHVHRNDINNPHRIRNYLFNRAARIYPAVWIMSLLAVLAYAAGFGGAGKAAKLSDWGITAGLLLLPQTGDALVNVTWTLKYELFFYLIFSFLILNRRLGYAVFCSWQVAVLCASFFCAPMKFGPRNSASQDSI